MTGLTYFQSANLHGKFVGTPRSCHRENSPLAAMVTREYYLPVASQLKVIQRDSVELRHPIDIHLWEKKIPRVYYFFSSCFSYKKTEVVRARLPQTFELNGVRNERRGVRVSRDVGVMCNMSLYLSIASSLCKIASHARVRNPRARRVGAFALSA